MVFKPVVEWKNPLFRILGYLLLFPFSLFYGIFAECRNILYDSGFFRKHTFESFIIGVGSLSVGGSGKTPLAEFLAIQLAQRGVRVGVISNGYRKTSRGTVIVTDGKIIKETVSRSGDEAYVMAINFIVAGLEIPVVSGSDRIEAVKICEEQFNCSVIIIDDAFQYRKIVKSLEIVVQDHMETDYPFFSLPVGRMREFRWNLKRATAVVITKTPDHSDLVTLRKKWGREPFISHYRPAYLQHWFDGKRESLNKLQGKSVLMFSGLGYHASFLALVRDLCSRKGATLLNALEFQDHHWYTSNDLQKIFGDLRDRSFEKCIILTTQKDVVKVKKNWVPDLFLPCVYFLQSEFTIEKTDKDFKVFDLSHSMDNTVGISNVNVVISSLLVK